MTTEVDAYELEYEQRTTITVKFTLSGDELSPDYITSSLGVTPSKGWARGDRIPKEKGSRFTPRPTYPFGKWILHAPCSKYDDLHIQIVKLLEVLEGLPPVLRDFIRIYSGEVSIGYSSGEDNIGFHFDYDLIRRIHNLGVELDIIVYPTCD